MGYEARGNGQIALNRKPEDLPAGIFNKAQRAFSEVEPSPDGGLWLTLEMDKYYEDDIKEFLTEIAPYTVSGHIEFMGEDDAMWRFVFCHGEWREERGRIVWEADNPGIRHSERMEMLNDVVEIFEDWLELKGIKPSDIENADRDQSGDDNAAIIYGDDYGLVTSKVEELLINFGLLEKER